MKSAAETANNKPATFAIRIASLCLAGYWLVIFLGTHLPSKNMPRLHQSDKILHFTAFAGLAFLLAWAIPKSGVLHTRLRHAMAVLGIVVLYAFLDENTQRFIPGRSCDTFDFLADVAGACAGLVGYLAIRQYLMNRVWGKRLIQRTAYWHSR